MRRLLISSGLALVAISAIASSASAATRTPVITSFSPAQVRVGQPLTINGKNFRKGVRNNRVFFVRASDGKTVRARPTTAKSTRRMTVIVPASITAFLTVVNGQTSATRFQLYLLSGKFSKKTARSKSPIVLPAGTTGNPQGPGSVPTTAPPPSDCDLDGTPDSTDTDDDNDGLSDDLEVQVHTDPCKKDTDGDGAEDGFEYYSAQDLNSNALPYPGKRPYPNALDASDGGKDFDGDGLTSLEEFSAWNLYGGRVLPSGPGQSFPYSDGNQTSTAGSGAGGLDFDTNGRLTDEEKDADGDGLANWVELAKGSTTDAALVKFGAWTKPNGTTCTFGTTPRFQDCGAGTVGNGNTFTDGSYASYYKPNWLDPDSDGDGVNDGADDLDHDDLSNLTELANGTNPVSPCDPNPESRTCQEH
jgi:thrombospondin type 3 repeat protein/IPT/TIG domain-containing protein